MKNELIVFLNDNLRKSREEKWKDEMFGNGWIAALMHVKVNFAELLFNEYNNKNYIPFQICPKCNGQGIVSKPTWVAGDVNEWTNDSASYYQCDLCNGAKVIPMYKVSETETNAHV